MRLYKGFDDAGRSGSRWDGTVIYKKRLSGTAEVRAFVVWRSGAEAGNEGSSRASSRQPGDREVSACGLYPPSLQVFKTIAEAVLREKGVHLGLPPLELPLAPALERVRVVEPAVSTFFCDLCRLAHVGDSLLQDVGGGPAHAGCRGQGAPSRVAVCGRPQLRRWLLRAQAPAAAPRARPLPTL
jgi:hypothetical protein